MTKPSIISASILAADFAHLGRDVEHVINAGVDYIHFDVMDHHFVPNLSIGPVVCAALRRAGISAPIDVHLMVEHPERYIEPFAKAGANLIAFHPETVRDTAAMLQRIGECGLQAGLVLNPDRPLSMVENQLEQIDLLLLMSVMPGFAGQQFIPTVMDKIAQARRLLHAKNSKAYLGVDGGVKLANIGQVSAAGADFFVMGSGVFGQADYPSHVSDIRQALSS